MKKIIYILVLVLSFSCVSTQAQNYKTHKVKKGETVESIAKAYNIPISTIYKLNPDSRKKLKPNSVLILPEPKKTEAKASKVTVTKELTGYTKHKVRRKETLYSLSQKYNVTQDEIKKHNTFLYANNLRKGDRLQIPVYKTITKVEEVTEATKQYTVQPKEGKWRIAYKFGITVAELEALNPEMGAVLQPGQTIKVPNLNKDVIKQVDETYSYYTVLPKEGFYRIKVKTGANKSTLEKLNPALAESGLKEGMILKIPYNSQLPTNANVPVTIADTITEQIEGTIKSFDQLSGKIIDTEQKRIAIMLPFKLNKVNVDSVANTKAFIKKDLSTKISLDFYSGALIALDSLQKLGVNLEVDVYDTKNLKSELNTILRNNDFSNTNAVIGPLMADNFNTVASALKSENVIAVSPIIKKVNLGANVFQSRPSDDALKNKIIAHFKADSTANIVVVTDIKNKLASTKLKNQFKNATLVTSRTDRKTKEDAYYVFEQDLVSVLKPGKNIVFLETKDDGYVSNVSSILNSLITDDLKITLATTDKSKAFDDEDVSNDHLSNLSFTFPSVSKMISEEDNNSFVKQYKSKYKETPNAYAVRGFDLTMDVVLRLVTSENLPQSVEDSPLTAYVENKFGYKKKLFGGYYNDTVYLVQYKDLMIVEVKQ
ncbi:PBP1 and LysM peptidoglycan-binding domain-containing protein [Pontimicrobium sp. MEBiC06410]